MREASRDTCPPAFDFCSLCALECGNHVFPSESFTTVCCMLPGSTSANLGNKECALR
ncbi:hypothetical protein EmuJ_001185800 [Echinococcus multilocularis]|uniref:Uncharacterized protein n=1 Tax=Echinococcus multilocularis TaxID=6211 RepID=A0A068XUA4_ECHMU|nr:hypothetical protein EmuJ_001185800 [Echinococcus multilocularis]